MAPSPARLVDVAANNNLLWRILAFPGICLALLAIWASIQLWDPLLTSFLRTSQNASLTSVASLLGVFGNPAFYFVPAAIAFLYFKFERGDSLRGNRALFTLLASSGAPFWTDILKLLFGRSRPQLLLEKGIYTFQPLINNIDFSSFPSEHATVAGAMAATFSIFIPSYRPTFFLAAILVAFSRVAIGRHYLSDVIAGLLVGIIAVSILKTVYDHNQIRLS